MGMGGCSFWGSSSRYSGFSAPSCRRPKGRHQPNPPLRHWLGRKHGRGRGSRVAERQIYGAVVAVAERWWAEEIEGTVRVTLLAEGNNVFVKEWELGEIVTVIRGP